MYFKNRVVAGKQLAEHLMKYKNEKTAVVALSDGGAIVGAQIAIELRCVVTMLLMEPIKLPGETEPLAMLTQAGNFTYNDMYSSGQLEELESEYYHIIEQERREKMGEMNRLLGKSGLIRKDLLRDHVVILVSDGLSSGFSVASAVEYLKTIHTKRVVIATPIANVSAVDRMHIMTDEIQCLGVIENYMDTNHYYEDNEMPSHDTIIGIIQNVVEHWDATAA